MIIFEKLKQLDAFGYRYNLKIKQQDKYRTACGGLAFILLVGLLAGLIFHKQLQNQQFYDIVKQDQQLLSQQQIQLSSMNILPYIQVSYTGDSQNTMNFLNQLMSFYQYSNQNFDSQIRICTRDQFLKVNSLDTYDFYQQQNVTLICLNQNIMLQPSNLTYFLTQTVNQALYFGMFQCIQNCLDQNNFKSIAQNFTFTSHIIQEQVDMTVSSGRPTKFVDQVFSQFQLDNQSFRNDWLVARQNQIQVQSIYYPFQQQQTYIFYDIDFSNSKSFLWGQQNFVGTPASNYFGSSIILSTNQLNYFVKYYNVLDYISWIGGWYIVLVIIFRYVFISLNEQCFYMWMIEENFCFQQDIFQDQKYKTENSNFNNTDNVQVISDIQMLNQKNENQNEIKFTLYQTIQFYVFDVWKSIFFCLKFSFMYQVYKKGKSILNRESDLIFLIKNLRNIRKKNKKRTSDNSKMQQQQKVQIDLNKESSGEEKYMIDNIQSKQIFDKIIKEIKQIQSIQFQGREDQSDKPYQLLQQKIDFTKQTQPLNILNNDFLKKLSRKKNVLLNNQNSKDFSHIISQIDDVINSTNTIKDFYRKPKVSSLQKSQEIELLVIQKNPHVQFKNEDSVIDEKTLDQYEEFVSDRKNSLKLLDQNTKSQFDDQIESNPKEDQDLSQIK